MRSRAHEPVEVGLEDVVVEDDDVGALGLRCPGGVGAAVEHRHGAIGQPMLRFALPGELHARGADHSGREGVVGLEGGERLNGLAEALLIGDEGAPALERITHSRTLERMELAAELQVVELGVLCVGQRHGLRGALVLGVELGDELAHRLVDSQLGVLVGEGDQFERQRRVRRHAHTPSSAAREKAPRAMHRARLGQALEVAGRAGIPAGEEDHLGLAFVADAEGELRGRRGVTGPQLACRRARQIVELDSLHAQQESSTRLAERDHQPVLRHLDCIFELLGGLAGQHTKYEGACALVDQH